MWERLGELEQANSELQQKQLEFEREKYDLHKQIAQLQRKLEKRTLCSDLVLYFPLLSGSVRELSHLAPR